MLRERRVPVKQPAANCPRRKGGRTRPIVNPEGDGEHSPHRTAKLSGIVLRKGQCVRIESPGGGGYGPAGDRPLEAIARDIALGLVSAGAAERNYRVSIAADGTMERLPA